MQYNNKLRSATNAPDPTNLHKQSSKALYNLQVLRDIALQNAIEYRFDPALGSAHKEYLNMLNDILKECSTW